MALNGLFPRWLTLCVMVWTAVWCCCTEPVRADTGKPERTCCAEEQTQPDHCPPNQADCPLIKMREQSQVAAPLVLPSFEPVLAWLPTYLSLAVEPTDLTVRFERQESADPPIETPTLVALHTCLLW